MGNVRTKKMTESQDFNLAVISDLHLSEGMDPITKRYSRNEDFLFDRQFCRFLKYLQGEVDRLGRNWKLIISGDMIDFLQVTSVPKAEADFEVSEREKEFGLGTEPKKTVWKLERIIEGHTGFFSGLAQFMSTGNRVVILPGNHDIEFCYTEVQEALRKGVGKFSKKDINNNLEFKRWFYHEKNLVFIEHGHQYDELNSFDYFLCPILERDEVKKIILPVGSFFVRYLFNRVEEFHPFADNIKPITRYLCYLIPRMIFRQFWKLRWVSLICFFIEVVKKVKRLSAEEKEKLEANQRSIMQNVSTEEGVPLAKVEGIRFLWVPSAITNYCWCQVIRKLFSAGKKDVYQRYALKIRDIFGVKYVVFGHTHDPDLVGFPSERNRISEYVNSSTWTKVFVQEESEEGLIREEKEFVFVQILKAQKRVRMHLLKWKDELGKAERVLLFKRISSGRNR
jgi:UDP-2,3-diacylglucosamine pyrophosphatase LpxH